MPYRAHCQRCGWIVFARNKTSMDNLCEGHDLRSHNHESLWRWVEITPQFYEKFKALYRNPALRKIMLQRLKEQFRTPTTKEDMLTLFAGA